MAGSVKKEKSELAVRVSYRLQFYTIFIAAATLALQAIAVVVSGFTIRQHEGLSPANLLPMFLPTFVFPLIVFAIAYFTTPRHAAPINRWFIATVKVLIVMLFFTILEGLQQWLTAAVYASRKSAMGPPPAWVFGNWSLYVMMAISLIVMVTTVYWLRRKE